MYQPTVRLKSFNLMIRPKGDGLASPTRIQACNDRSRLGQPVRRLNDAKTRCFDQLKNLKGLERVSVFGTISKDPLDDHTGIEYDRHHGLPRLLAARMVLSVTRRLRFLKASNCSTTFALR